MILYLNFSYWTFDWRATPVDVRRAADGIGVWAWLRGNIDLEINFKVQISKKLHHYGRDWTGGSRVELIVGRLVWRCTVLSIINLIFSCEVRSFYFACWYAAGDGWLKHKNLSSNFDKERIPTVQLVEFDVVAEMKAWVVEDHLVLVVVNH
jgi:hypothetical protein